MRSRLLVLGLAPLALAACGGGGTPAPAPAKPTAAPATRTITITVQSIRTMSRTEDRAPKGASTGDRVEFADVLLNTAPRFGKAAKARIGRDTGTLTFTSRSTASMKGVATLPDGTIAFEGAMTMLPDDTVTVPIVGGTGAYANASGTLLVGRGPKRAPNTYRIVLGGRPAPVA